MAINDAPPTSSVDFDHHSPAFAADPHGIASVLRAGGVTHSDHHGGYFIASRYADVRSAALRHETFTNGLDPQDPTKQGAALPTNEGRPMLPEESAGAEHTTYRRAMAPYFTSKAAKAQEDRLRYWADVCFDEVIESGECDLITQITGPVALLFFCEMIGLPLDDWRRWYEPLHALLGSTPGTPEHAAAVEAEIENDLAMAAFVEDRRANPQDDLMSRLAQARSVDGELLTVSELTSLGRNVILGAIDSVGSLISQALVELEGRHEDIAWMLADPANLDTAIEEFLRYFSPGAIVMRTATEPAEVGGQSLSPGDRLALLWVGANRDPEVFEDPHELRFDREQNRHLAFGAGVHKCLGLHFARLEARIFFQTILTRMPDFRVVDEGTAKMSSFALFTGYRHLRLQFTPGDRVQGDRMPGR